MKTLTEFVQNPTMFLTEITERKNLSYACFGYAFGIISLYFAIKLGCQNRASVAGFIFAFAFWFITNVILNFVLAAICNSFLEITKNKSSALGIFTFLGLSQIIWTLAIPCLMIARAFPISRLFMPLVILGIIIGQIYFVLKAIKQVYEIKQSVSLLAFVGAFILPMVAGFFFFCFIIGFIVALTA